MNSILVLMETDGEEILNANWPTIKFAQELSRSWNVDFDMLAVGGPQVAQGVNAWLRFGARRLWTAATDALSHPTADKIAAVTVHFAAAHGPVTVVGGATTFGKDVLPRVAEALEAPMVSDVVAIAPDPSGLQFVRPMYAGNILATVGLSERLGVFSVRPSAFRDPVVHENLTTAEAHAIDVLELPTGAEWVSLEAAARKRPDLTAARAVVSGGRPLRDAETFERLLGGLADALGGAVGATRAAVDRGLAPNELQVGQTGKIVAPDLYIAAGVSGSVQHLAGMKDSRVIVAINTDPDAPIFSVADYGLVADLHQAVPELTEAIKKASK